MDRVKLNLDSKGNGKVIEKPEWKIDKEVYFKEAKSNLDLLLSDLAFLAEQQKYNPNVNIKLTLEKAYNNYWGTEAGWKNKKGSSKIQSINWKSTYINAISNPLNKVYLSKDGQENGYPERIATFPEDYK